MNRTWKDMIGGCFGSEDRKFAGHPSNTECAINLLQECNKNTISLSTLLKEIESYLKNDLDFNAKTTDIQNNMQKHINKELEKVKEKFENWLD